VLTCSVSPQAGSEGKESQDQPARRTRQTADSNLRSLYATHYEPLPTYATVSLELGAVDRTNVHSIRSPARATMCGISMLHAEWLSSEEGLHQVVVELVGLRHSSSPLSMRQACIRFVASDSILATCSASPALRSADALSRSASFAWRSAHLSRSSSRSCLRRDGGVSAPQPSMSAASSSSRSVRLRLSWPHVVQEVDRVDICMKVRQDQENIEEENACFEVWQRCAHSHHVLCPLCLLLATSICA